MKTYFWSRLCPHCDGEGRLIIMKDLTHDSLYLHCEECEWGWRNPDTAADVASGFLTLDEEFDAEPASNDEIVNAGWAKHVAGHFQE